jgi:hypothetical protein
MWERALLEIMGWQPEITARFRRDKDATRIARLQVGLHGCLQASLQAGLLAGVVLVDFSREWKHPVGSQARGNNASAGRDGQGRLRRLT